MPARNESDPPVAPEDPDDVFKRVLGYLNFSSGKPDSSFLAQLDQLAADVGFADSWQPLRDVLEQKLAELSASEPAFADCAQASALMPLVFDHLLPEYRDFHKDLLFHLGEHELQNTFFLGRCCEAVLAQGGPWDETQRVVDGAIAQLNDFLGYRPLAILENDQQMEPYDHERHRPLPLFVAGSGVCSGPHKEIVEQALKLLSVVPPDVLHGAHFDLDRMEEMALDLGAYDHDHPVFKRTNYLFGEWDPHCIDNKGYYRRFVVRQIIMGSLIDWVNHQSNRGEAIFDAGAVLCGTILMASAISGDGPACHHSEVTLSSLLPMVARQRDDFYVRLLETVDDKRKRRLNREAGHTLQPFGHVRQSLNLHLAHYGARQTQYRHLASIYARMGHAEAARQCADIIPSCSARFECEVQWRLTAARSHLARHEVDAASELLRDVEGLIFRGIHCGAFVDPWNILGFQGNFPLFAAREDSIPDGRVEVILDLMDRTFDAFSRALSEAAVHGRSELVAELATRFEQLAGYWDQFAAHVIDDLPRVFGGESLESARHVAAALAEWRAAGEAAGDISFWSKHVEKFTSARSYACVVEALLDGGDHVAAMALLMQWLACADEVGIEYGPFSIHALLLDWMKKLTTDDDGKLRKPVQWDAIRRLFDFLEANAGDYWDVPQLDSVSAKSSSAEPGLNDWDIDRDDDWFDDDDDDDNLFEAAYEEVVYRDSTDDGFDGEVHDGGGDAPGNTEFEVINRELEPRIKFIMAMAQLWQSAVSAMASEILPGVMEPETPSAPVPTPDSEPSVADGNDASTGKSTGDVETGESQEQPAARPEDDPAAAVADPILTDEQIDVLTSWWKRLSTLQSELISLMNAVWEREVELMGGDHDANVEFDIQLQTKFYLLNTIIAAHINCRVAEIGIVCLLPSVTQLKEMPEHDGDMIEFYRSVMRQDIPAVKQRLGSQFRRLQRKPLLYVPLDGGGHPTQVLVARTVQTDIRFLLTQLPRLGLFRETWHVVRLAHRMERETRPGQMAVTEFDRIFRAGLRNTIEALIESATRWNDGDCSEEDLISLIGDVLQHYRDQWYRHSRTMRLSSVEGLRDDLVWDDIKEFVELFGEELFHARSLTLGNVRTILHNGIEWFLEQLAEYDDPLHPHPLLESLENGEIELEEAVETLELIYGSVVDRFDRFLEYNTTTTQSDYGNKFYVLLDFLRVEAAYDRDAWERIPESIVHRALAMAGRTGALRILEEIIEAECRQDADRHVESLQELEEQYGVHLPAVADRLNERFVKPLSVNRMLALVEASSNTGARSDGAAERFEELRKEIDNYMQEIAGSAIDIPQWLQDVEREVNRLEAPSDYIPPPELDVRRPVIHITEEEVRNQLEKWGQAIADSERSRRKSTRRRRKKP
jgi:hypothetical protein